MSGMIKLVGNSGSSNNPPKIRNFRQEGLVESNFFDIKYIAEDFENTILRHYIYIDGQKMEITKDVGYEKPNNEFAYRVSNLKINTPYKIQIEVTDGIDTIRSDILSISTANKSLFGIRIMENNSNPQSCCSYLYDAVGISPFTNTSLGGWSNKFPFNQIKLVGFKNGKETKDINPKNKLNYLDGSTVPSDVDIMVKIPKIYWNIESITNGYEIKISNVKYDSNYDCYAHKINGIEKDYIYVGAYLGYIEDGKLRSKSGVTPSTSYSLSEFRQYSQANGNGYQQMNWYTYKLIQILFVLAYKNLNSQSALGQGVVSGSNNINGGTNTKGLIYGTSSKSEQICFLGIENLWGVFLQMVDGVVYDSSRILKVTSTNVDFNDKGNGYENIGIGAFGSNRSYIGKVEKENKSIFFPTKLDGSQSTYYCDEGYVATDRLFTFGGGNSVDLAGGIFHIYLYYQQYGHNSVTSRLCYLG